VLLADVVALASLGGVKVAQQRQGDCVSVFLTYTLLASD
jgi:hypothetical protein